MFKKYNKSEAILGLLLCSPAILLIFVITGYPVLYSIWLSLHTIDLHYPNSNSFVGLSNYLEVLGNHYWWQSCLITLIISSVSLLLELILGLALALVMYYTVIFKSLMRTVILIPYGIVTLVASFSWRFAWLQNVGYLTNAFSLDAPLTKRISAILIIILAEVWKTTPFMALLLMSGLTLVSNDLLKVAAIDGANIFTRFVKIMLPVMKPAIVIALLFRSLDSFRVFDSIYILTNGSNGTGSVSVQTYNNLIIGLNLGIGSTMSVLIFLMIIIISFIFIKLFKVNTLKEKS